MLRPTEMLPWRSRAWTVPLTAAATLAIGLLFLALDVPLNTTPMVRLEHAGWVHAALLVLGCLALLVKRRAPLTVLAGATALFAADITIGGTIGVLLVLVDAIYSAALHTSDRGRRVLLAIIATLAIGGTVLVLVLSGDLRLAAFTALQLVAVVVTPYWWGLAVQRERSRAALEAQRADDLERLAALTQQEVVQAERGRMARDLHDAIASELSAIAIHTEAALAAPQPQRSSLETIRAASIRSLEQMRSMILVLRAGGDAPAAPDRLSDAEGIIGRARERGLDVTLVGEPPPMPVAIDQAAGRILQESLTNAMKHAPGATATVRVERTGDALTLRVESAMDASARPSAPPSAGLGVRMMRERATALGGELTAGPDREGGARWTVQTTLPLTA
ncbi:sensor histidine kinase [Agrococcus baldri]|uniref:histidine kinase n=1 Tax=Agrococcus baldri TaxID=153730 RepID=A0AA87RKJ4_9MICO|nr:histidine kinase [Agrococcus baldri]GEK80868.1 two-component sensor histidine kinase [Agrococcus baldri]